jgi:hypothetical protein
MLALAKLMRCLFYRRCELFTPERCGTLTAEGARCGKYRQLEDKETLLSSLKILIADHVAR